MFKLVNFGRAAILETLTVPLPPLCVPAQTHIDLFISLLLPGEMHAWTSFLVACGYLSLAYFLGHALTFTQS